MKMMILMFLANALAILREEVLEYKMGLMITHP